MRLLLLFFVVGSGLYSLIIGKRPAASPTDNPPPMDDAATITFILGPTTEDHFYAPAADYFATRPQVVTAISSLVGVYNYLQTNAPATGYWQRVELVVSGNPWSGLDAPLYPDDARPVTAATLSHHQTDGPLASVDYRTEIVLHGASAGQDAELLVQLSRIFAGEAGAYPRVLASRMATLFRRQEGRVARTFAEEHFLARRPGEVVDTERLKQDYARRFPGRDPDLLRLAVPIEWLHVYDSPEQRFLPLRPAERERWLSAEPILLRRLNRMGLKPEHFRWKFTAEDLRLEDGRTVPTVRASGRAWLDCVRVPTSERPVLVGRRYQQV